MESLLQQEFRIDPSLRRSCWYVVVAAPLLAGVAFWTLRFVQDRNPLGEGLTYTFFAVLPLAMIPPLRWKLRITEDGIERRRVFRWDDWSWDDFASGKIEKKYYCTLVDPDRSWWRRKLSLGSLSRADFKRVIADINEHYKLPPPPNVPDALTIRFRFRCSATLNETGIQLSRRGRLSKYTWPDVQQVHITRVDPLRRDFVAIVIHLPDDEIALQNVANRHRAGSTWRGPDSKEINEYLQTRLPADKIETAIDGELPKTQQQLEWEVNEAVKLKRALLWNMGASSILFVALFSYSAIDEGLVHAIVMTCIAALLVLPLAVAILRVHDKRIDTLKNELARAKDAAPSDRANEED